MMQNIIEPTGELLFFLSFSAFNSSQLFT
uniref:Uncharacterized protein n=1 Tax=Arundo donax TaxID=35708 RepID=A0A0A8ZXH0_ARUDO